MRDAHEAGDTVVIYGQAGLGKTQAVKNYCEKNPAAILIEANPSFTALVLMRKLAAAAKVSTVGSLNDLFESVSDRLRDSGRLIVVDEAENLPLRALEIIRRLHDDTGCGLVLSGMPRLVANLRGKHGELVQLYSRVSVALNLGDSMPDEELEEIARAAMPEADDATIAELVKQSNGNTRRMSKLMRGAVRTANKNGIKMQSGIIKNTRH
ncbi:phage transposase [Neisseria mucosa]|nr:phage transposase [Neisseria mucosa]